jgi:PAS domain S-box-containing protein
LDGLLEAFHKQDAMTESQIVDLGLKLTEIRDSITGQVMDGQPTLAGDRMAAAIILQVMDQRDLAVQDIGHPQDALILVDPAGVISFISLAAERLTGYREDELRGVPIEILVPDEMHEEHDKLRDGYIQHPEVRAMGVEKSCLLLRRKDGTVIPVWIDLAPTVLGPTKETFVIATIRPRTGGGADGAK